MFEAIVIGKGLFGAAATRYLSQSLSGVAVIGPDEPVDPATHTGVYGAHYDEARIIHSLNDNLVWAVLTERTRRQFNTLTRQSGLSFHQPVGNLYVVSPAQDHGHIPGIAAAAITFNITYEQPDHPTQQAAFPYLCFPTDCKMIWEQAPSGYFNPRTFLQAQLSLSEQQGATIIRDIATTLTEQGDTIEVTTQAGGRYQTRRVLIASGAFSNGFDFFSRDLALRLKIEFVVMAEVSPATEERLRDMPPVIYLLDSPALRDAYLLPPVRYPDGKFYLKLGANTEADRYVQSLAEICDWYRAGNSDEMLPALQAALLEIMPEVEVLSWHTRRCVITRTAHGCPYIDTLVPGKLYVAVGGNGQGAQAADAVGELAAKLVVNDEWSDDLDPTAFRVRFADEGVEWRGRTLF